MLGSNPQRSGKGVCSENGQPECIRYASYLFRTITVSIPVIPVHFTASPKSLVTTMETEVMTTIYLNRLYIKQEISRPKRPLYRKTCIK